MKEVPGKRKLSRSRRFYNWVKIRLLFASFILKIILIIYIFVFPIVMLLLLVGIELFTTISIKDSFNETRSPGYFRKTDAIVDTYHGLRLTIPKSTFDFPGYQLSDVETYGVDRRDPRFLTMAGFRRTVQDVKFGNAFAIIIYFGFLLWVIALSFYALKSFTGWLLDLLRHEVILDIPKSHYYDREPPAFETRGRLVQRGKQVFERNSRSFSDTLEDNTGCISLGGQGCFVSGCLTGCLVMVWPLGLLWLACYVIAAIISAIQVKAGYRYVCTRADYDKWVNSTRARYKQFEAQEKEKYARIDREREQAKRDAIVAEQNAVLAKQLALRRAEAAKQERLKRLRFDNWVPEGTEQFVRHLPGEWWPLKTVGLAYANVVPYSSPPAGQRYLAREGRWETIGKQETALRGVYLLGTTAQRTMNKNPLVVGPDKLRGTTSQDLVMFVIDASGEVKYLGNPARFEIYSAPSDDEEAYKLERLKPVLAALYKQVLDSGPASSGWV